MQTFHISSECVAPTGSQPAIRHAHSATGGSTGAGDHSTAATRRCGGGFPTYRSPSCGKNMTHMYVLCSLVPHALIRK